MNYSSTSVQHDSPQCVRVIPKLFPQRRAQFRKHEVQSLLEEEEGSGRGWGEGEEIQEGVGKRETTEVEIARDGSSKPSEFTAAREHFRQSRESVLG